LMAQVWHYDGASGIRYTPELVAEGDHFRLALEEGLGQPHAWSDLVFTSNKDGTATYGHKTRRGWRIGFDGPIPAEIAARLPRPEKYGRFIDRIGLWPASGAFIAISAAALFVGLKAPDLLAPLVPASFEQKLGDAMVGDFGGRVCNGPGGQEALDALVKRIEGDPKGLKVRVVNIDMVNAVALPGGNVFIFRGLLQEAKSPDELAGVLGHEIGHVRNRDVMQALLRQMGLSILLGGANSDVGGSINALVSSTYSREAESNADIYSIKAMQRGQVSPEDTAGFFARLAQMEKSLGKGKSALGYLSSHPLSEAREKAFRGSLVKGRNYTPAVTAEQWRAIVDSCKNDPDVEEDDGLLF
jgi:beta-barrel assembly-enhancing protease